LGTLLNRVVNNGLDLLNVPAYYEQNIKGSIIIGGVGMDRRGRR
jgi:ribose/xylose/arabinose/galactoside ABC-type transport system permease subunit